MNKQLKYWLIGIAVVVVILITWYALAYGNTNNDSGNNNANNNSTNNNGNDNVNGSDNDNKDDQNLTSYLKDQDSIMKKMMDDMKNIPNTKDPAVDYLNGMIPHHVSAVAMSNSYLQYGGKNPDIKQIAEEIIKAQTKEIEDMNNIIQELKTSSKPDETKGTEYLNEYNKLVNEPMTHSSHLKSVDEAYAEGMIMHHQMAVDMSKIVLKYTDNEKITKMAQDIVEAQEKEIKYLEKILETLKK